MSWLKLVRQATTPLTPNANNVRVYVNSGGTLSSVDETGLVTTYAAGITQEQVEDFVGALLQDSSSINVTYNDAGNAASFDVIAGGVNHNALLNYVPNEHINHASVSITAGAGLSGGGDLTVTRTLVNADRGSVAVTSHEAAVDPHPQYTTAAELTAGLATITTASIGAQPLDSDLTAIAGLATQGVLVRTGAGTATTRTITQGTGITVTNGDGVAGNPTVALTNVGTAGTYGSATQIPQITTNAQGQVSSVTNTLIAIPFTQVTDFTEAAQDAVGGILTDSSSIDFTYNDGGNSIQAFVIPGGVDHNGLVNLAVGNPHTQYLLSSAAATTYQPLDTDLTAIAGLATQGLLVRTGAGTATTRFIAVSTGLFGSAVDGVAGNPTIGIATTGVGSGTFGSATQVGSFTVNPQGQLTAASAITITPAFGSITGTPTTLAGYGITDAQPLDTDLTAIAGLAGTGIIARTGTGTAITRTITNGTAINVTNGDGVSGNPTISLPDTSITPAAYGSASQVPSFTVDQQGRLNAAANVAIAIPSTQVTDFSEAVQDVVGALLTDSASVDFTYNDAGGTGSFAVLPAGVNHDALQNFVANKHIDHSTVAVNAGTGLSGGGDLTATRTISMPNVGTPGTYGSAAVYPVITTDAQGRVTAVTTQAVPGGSLTAKTSSVLTNNSNATLTNIPQLTLTLAANTTYLIKYVLIMQSVATGTGVALAYNAGTLVPTSVVGNNETSVTTTVHNRLNFVSLATTSVFSGVAVANQNQIVDVKIKIVVGGTGGTLIPQFRSEVNGSQVTLSIDSSVEAKII